MDFTGAAACLVTAHWKPQAKAADPIDLVIVKRGQTLLFGRAKTANVVLSNGNVSHKHFELTHDEANNEITIKDHSKRGTFVNGHNLKGTTATLHEGDEIKVEEYVWNLTNPTEIEAMLKNARGAGKVKNSIVGHAETETSETFTDSVVADGPEQGSPKRTGGILATPMGKLRGLFSPRRSSSAVSNKRAEDTDEKSEDMNMSASITESTINETTEKRSSRFRRSNSNISSELEVELQHKAKKQPAVASSKKTNIVYKNIISSDGSKDIVRREQKTINEEEEVSAASLVVSSNKKIRDIYSTVLEAHSNKDVPTLENLTTDTIHSVMKCAADANEGFQNDLKAVMEKSAGLANQFTEAAALYDAVAQGKGFPFASGRILKERVRYCAQLEARLKDHQALYEQLLKSRDLMFKKLESVRVSCGVARSILAEYQRLYDSVYARINAEIPRPTLDREAPNSLTLQRIVLTPEEVKEITRAINLGEEGVDEELNGLLGAAPTE